MALGDEMAQRGNIPEIRGLLKNLFDSQSFAVLATLATGGHPYTNLVAFAETDSLRSLLFVTGRDTKKYSNAVTARKVAVLVDSRTNQVSDVNTAIAATALGTVEEVPADKRDSLLEVYVSKHPHLLDFATNPVNALMKVAVTDYIIATFDKVTILHVGD
jgi:hypothetical protein